MDHVLLITGSRRWTNEQLVRDEVWWLRDPIRDLLIVGDCPTGADSFARCAAYTLGVSCHVEAALWGSEGRKAGPLRNSRMVALAKLHNSFDHIKVRVRAFVDEYCRGTLDCLRKAQAAGLDWKVIRDI